MHVRWVNEHIWLLFDFQEIAFLLGSYSGVLYLILIYNCKPINIFFDDDYKLSKGWLENVDAPLHDQTIINTT